MVVSLPWLQENWFNLTQTFGIVASALLAAAAFSRETRARRLGYLLSLAEQHREVWSEAHRRPELARIFKSEVDLVADPISTVEQEFLNIVIVHFHTGWLFAKDTRFLDDTALTADARTFFSLPLPRAVWDNTRDARDPKFVRLMEKAFASMPPGFPSP